MILKFFDTQNDLKLFILRVTAGIVVLAHGVQKLFGWFGGHGPQFYIESFAQWFGFPPLITVLVILSDTLGALMLILGAAARFAAFSIAMVMLGAIYFVHGRWGFFMNWYTEQRGEGFEFHLLILVMTIIITVWGAGKWSVDNQIAEKLQNRSYQE